jgi:hypothetical protein
MVIRCLCKYIVVCVCVCVCVCVILQLLSSTMVIKAAQRKTCVLQMVSGSFHDLFHDSEK